MFNGPLFLWWFSIYVSHYQRVNLHFPMVFPWFPHGIPPRASRAEVRRPTAEGFRPLEPAVCQQLPNVYFCLMYMCIYIYIFIYHVYIYIYTIIYNTYIYIYTCLLQFIFWKYVYDMCIYVYIYIWLVVYLPLWEIWVRQLGWLFPIWWNMKVMFQSPPTSHQL